MKARLRLKGKIRPEKQRSVGRCQQSAMSYQPSELSCQLSDTDRYVPAISKLIPKAYHLVPEKQLSAVSNQTSVFHRWLPIKTRLIPEIYHLIPILILVFVSCSAVLAQEPVGHTAPAAQAEKEITPLTIGDRIPDELWEMYFPVVSANSDEVQYLSLGDFRDKLIVLDFWATWCGSCIYAFPNNFILANEFKNDLLIMPVGINNELEIRKFMTTHKNGKYLPESIMDKEILKQYFPHRFIPHYVWIYNGKLVSVTDSDQLKPAHVKDVLNGANVAVRQKNDVFDFDIRDPFDKNWGSLFEGQVVAKMTLTKFIDGIGSWVGRDYNQDSSVYRHSSINRPLISIYNLAVKKPWNHFLNESSDKSMFEDSGNDQDWFRKNTYCYEYFVPKDMAEERIGEIIVNDLNVKLNLNSRLEKRLMDCYVVVYDEDWTDGKAVLQKGSTPKMSLDEISLSFNNRRKYDRHSYQSPPILINEAIIKESFVPPPVSIIDIENFNVFMKPQGVMAVPAQREIEVFVLSDSK